MAWTIFFLFVGFQLKHVVADYLLQPGWMIAGKGDLRHPGGHAHAGVHALLSGVVMLLVSTPLPVIAGLVVAEYIAHYALDFSKAHYSAGVDANGRPSRYWALHGLDQFSHQVCYALMMLVVLSAKGML